MRVVARLLVASMLLTLAPTLLGAMPATAAGMRTVSATASCNPDGANGKPDVEIKLTNHSGGSLAVGYVYGFTTPKVFTVRMIQDDQGKAMTAIVPDQRTPRPNDRREGKIPDMFLEHLDIVGKKGKRRRIGGIRGG